MAAQRPLIITAGQIQRLPVGDVVAYEQTASSFTIASGQYAIVTHFTMTGANRATLAGTARVVAH